MEFFVSLLQARNNLPSFWAILVIPSMLRALDWKSVSASLASSFSHSHSLSDHDTFSVNQKTNSQDIRTLLLIHYRQLLMATYTAKNTH